MEEEKYTRPDWDTYFMNIVEEVSTRGTCDRGRTAAVIVKDKRILTTGYVGAPPGMAHCDEVGHLMQEVVDDDGVLRKHCVRTVHGEENAILDAAARGVALKGSTLYCKMTPCFKCTMQIISVGIVRIVAKKKYHADGKSRELLKAAGIELIILDDSLVQYENQ